MAVSLNFRSALGGFNREDVVQYIEFMNSKHTRQIGQLTNEAAELRRKLEMQPETPDLSETVSQLTAQLADAAVRQAELEQQIQRLQDAHTAALAEIDALNKEKAAEAENTKINALELEAYRRAEQVERNARIRAEQIYQQATGTLAQATTQVDAAAAHFRGISEQINGQMNQLQLAIEESKNALLDAADTMYTIRPQSEEAE